MHVREGKESRLSTDFNSNLGIVSGFESSRDELFFPIAILKGLRTCTL